MLWRISDSNRRPFDCEPNALPTELIPRFLRCKVTTYFSFAQHFARKKNAETHRASAFLIFRRFYFFSAAKLSRKVFNLLSASACFLRSFSTISGLAFATNFSLPSLRITEFKNPSR